MFFFQSLWVPGRVLVGEGVLTKMCRKKKKARQFFLFNDILVYGNIIINKKKYNKQHIIPLEEVKLENDLEESKYIFNNIWIKFTIALKLYDSNTLNTSSILMVLCSNFRYIQLCQLIVLLKYFLKIS